MGIDLRHMLKVYNYVNDEKRPKVNLKFLGFFVAFLVSAGALALFAWDQSRDAPSSEPVAAQSRSEYVGYSAQERANPSLATLTPQQHLDRWFDAHPTASIERVDPVYDNGLLVGYTITYRP